MYLLVHSYLSGVAQADLEEIFTRKVEEKGTWQAWQEMEELRERIDGLSTRPDQADCREDLWVTLGLIFWQWVLLLMILRFVLCRFRCLQIKPILRTRLVMWRSAEMKFTSCESNSAQGRW